ncbi:MAG TPA: ABC transporter permease [Bacilli bacterium]
MVKQVRKIFFAQLKTTFREKAVWFWSIGFPVLLLIIFLTIFAAPEDEAFSANVALVMENENPATSQLAQTLRQIPALEWKTKEPVTKEEAEKWVKDKEVDAAIVLPTTAEGGGVSLLLNAEKQNSTLDQALAGILNHVLQQVNYAIANVQPAYHLQTDYLSASERKLDSTDFLVTGLLALSIAQSGLFGMVGLVEMRRNGMLKRLKLTPVSIQVLGISDVLVRFILALIQVVILVGIGIAFGAGFAVNVPAFLLTFVIGTLSFTAFGFMIASFSKAMEGYMGIANLASFIMMFLSGVFFDYSMLPGYIKPIADAIPLTYFVNGIRESMVYGTSVAHANIWLNVAVMAAWGVVTFLIGSRFYKWKAG